MKKHSNVQHIAIKNKWGAPDQQTNRVLGFVTAILGMKSCRNSRDQWRFPKMELPQNHGCFNTKSRSSMTCLDDLGCPYDKTEPSVKSWMFHSNPSIISIKSPYILPSPGSRTCCCFILPRESSVWSCDGGGFFWPQGIQTVWICLDHVVLNFEIQQDQNSIPMSMFFLCFLVGCFWKIQFDTSN